MAIPVEDFHGSFKEGIDPYKQIDFALDFIRDRTENRQPVSHTMLESYIIYHRKTIGIKRLRQYQIIDKLKKDGYIVIRGNYQLYDITFEGVIFEGYQVNQKSLKSQRKLETLKMNLLIVGSWMAGIGTVGLFLSEILKPYLHIQYDLKSALILLIFGMCIGGTILATIQELVKRKSK